MTRYDEVAYPSTAFPQTSPDRLAAIARLHGLAPPPVETARILEIGGGDGINIIAMAVAWPQSRSLSFDISASAVARGKAIVDAVGIDNVRIEFGDILTAAHELDGTFDYVIAHGVYAWVPEIVRDAVMAVIGRVLADNGVAFVSYNALPGCHLRRALREMTLRAIGHIESPGERLTAARAFLADFAEPRAGDRAVLVAMREVAKPMSTKLLSTLFHDELGDCYAPQSLADVISAARAHGLEFLNDAIPAMITDGLPGEDLDDLQTVAIAQAGDDQALAFFHETLLVRAGHRIARRVDTAGVSALHIASQAKRTGPDSFTVSGGPFKIGDARLADAIERLGSIWPQRLPVKELFDDPEVLAALVDLHGSEAVTLHAGPLPGVREAGSHPVASPLARAQIAAGSAIIQTLDMQTIAFVDPGPRAFLGLLDGSRDREALARDWAATPYGREVDVDTALARFASAVLLSR